MSARSMFRPADWLVIASCAAFIVALAVLQWRTDAPATSLEIRGMHDTLKVPLEREAMHTIEGPLGASVVEVKDGRARFIEAPCANRVCIAAGWVGRDGDLAACLPNRATIVARSAAPRYDAIAY